MSEIFIKIFQKELQSTLSGLIGESREIFFTSDFTGSERVAPAFPYLLFKYAISGDFTAQIGVILLEDLSKELLHKLSKKDLDAQLQEEDANILGDALDSVFGAISSHLHSQKSLPKLTFSRSESQIILDKDPLAAFERAYQFSSQIIDRSGLYFLSDGDFLENFKILDEPITQKQKTQKPAPKSTPALGQNNMNILLDVKLNLRVRIGQKRMLLKDILSMDIGSVIELNQLANEPLDILIEDKVIAKGEVVVIDGNFGVQITEILLQK